MKNITYRGFSSFIKALRKHVLAGTYANFWTEVHSRKHALVHSKFTLAGEPQTIVYMNQLVDRMIEKMADITEQEMLDVINQVLRISFMFEQKYFFMISVNEAQQATDVVENTTPSNIAQESLTEASVDVSPTEVLVTEDNQSEQATDTLELIKEVEADIDAARQQELKAMTVKELREILKARGIKFAPASKEAKLIELVLGSDKS